MITITSIRNVDYKKYDEVWAVVRSLKTPNSRITHVPELSPSWNLFKQYLSLRESGDWNQKSFQDIYVPQFLKESAADRGFRQKLDTLMTLNTHGRHICLVCFCPDETLCHRSVLAGILQGSGHIVDGVHADYSHYANLWAQACAGVH